MTWGSIRFVERRAFSTRWSRAGWSIVVMVLTAGFVMAAVAGGRRAATSYDRLLRWSDWSDANTGGLGVDTSEQADAALTTIAKLPMVESASRTVLFGGGVRLSDGHEVYVPSVLPIAPTSFEDGLGRIKIVSGRAPRPDRVDEAAMGFLTGDLLDLRVGDHITVLLGDGQITQDVTIVGSGAAPGGFPTLTGRPPPFIILTPAFVRAHEDFVDWTNGSLSIQLRGGPAAVPEFRDAVAKAGINVDAISSEWELADGVRRVVTLEARVLWALAIIVGGAGAVLLVQMSRRDRASIVTEVRTLQANGLGRRDFALVGLWRGVRTGSMAAAGAVAGAIGVSPLVPVGLARTAEPGPGFHADLAVIGPGVLAVFMISAALAVLSLSPGRRASVRRLDQPGRLRSIIGRLRPAGATGAHMAFGAPGGTSATSGSGAIVATVVAAAVLMGTVSVQASFERLLGDPSLSGGTWDATLVYDNATDRAPTAAQLSKDNAVEAFTPGGWDQVLVNGAPVYSMIFEEGRGLVPAVDGGRAPRGVAEIALGARQLHQLRLGVGDVVTVTYPSADGSSSPGRPIEATITGETVLSSPLYQALKVGEGGAFTTAAYTELTGGTGEVPSFFVRFRSHNHLVTRLDDLSSRVHPNFAFARGDNAAVSSLRSVGDLARLLLIVLAVMCAAALAQRMVSTVGQMRKHLAVLRGLGCTGRQIRVAHVVHGLLTSLAIAMLAIPIGLVASRQVWLRSARALGVVNSWAAAFASMLWIGAAIVLFGLLVGTALSAREGRQSMTAVLRQE